MKQLKWLWLLSFSYFFYLMLQILLKYIPFNSDIGFLEIKQTEVTSLPAYLPIFYIHVYSTMFVLLAGFSQFNSYFLKKYKKIHTTIGKIYVYVVLLFAAPSGIYIGYYANGGIISQISFITLGILWFYFTYNGIIAVKNKKISVHQKMMYRSFALAFSAITLRLWKVVLVYFFEPNPIDNYIIISLLGWIPNLLLIEYLIYTKKIKL